MRSLFLSCIMLLGMGIHASATLSFVGGFLQNARICQNSPGGDPSGFLSVNESTAGLTLTWNISSGPSVAGSTLVGSFTTTAVAGVNTVSPGSFVYTPAAGYSGYDMFTITVTDDGGFTVASTSLNVAVLSLPGLTPVVFAPQICAGTTSAAVTYTGLTGTGPQTDVFTATGAATWSVPAGVTSIDFDVQGAAGGNDNVSPVPLPGFGGRVQGTLAVTPFDVLNLNVGGPGDNGTTSGANGGVNGGGNAHYYPLQGCGGGGGGASDIRMGGTGLGNRVVVAGGGGGSGWDGPHGPYMGGNGGGTTGGNSEPNSGGSAAMGGGTTAGGAGAVLSGWMNPGNPGALGMGGDGSIDGVSGGGGGGNYGGGGGLWNGGGGGSSYTDATVATLVTHVQGYNPGSGQIAIHYNFAGTYSIDWSGDAGAVAAGFANVNSALLTASPLTFPVPAGAAPNTYTGMLTIDNGFCTSTSYPITLTINPIPTVNVVGSTSYCNGDATANINYTGAVTPASYDWTNDNSSIGIASTGTGDILSFPATNSTANPVTANITVTPSANSCVGASMTFQITVNPTPMLSTSDSVAVCDSALFSYPAASATAATGFAWSRASAIGITNPPAFGGGDPLEYLDNNTFTAANVAYVYTLTANGCSNVQTVNVTVNPTPMLSSALTVSGVCPGTPFTYHPTSSTPGTSITWSRNIATGVTNPAVPSASGDVNEVLNNISPYTVPDPYAFIMTANGCTNIQSVSVDVYPTPMLTSALTNAAICSGSPFNYIPVSTTPGATFQWNRPPVVGLANTAIYGNIAPIGETLTDTTNTTVTVTYQFTVIANGCAGSQTDVTVNVNPIPQFTGAPSATVCDGVALNYMPSGTVAGTSYTWVRPAVVGLSNVQQLGINNITETLHDTTANPVTVNYKYYLAAMGCYDTAVVKVTVNPTPKLTSTLAPPSVCDSTLFDYAPKSSTSNATYAWTRSYVAGIGNPPKSGSGNPHEPLFNTTNVDVSLSYAFVVSANGCSSSPYSVGLTVHPTARLSSKLSNVVCSGVPFTYQASSYTAGATYQWDRYAVPGIFGSNFDHDITAGKIKETLINTTNNPVKVTYYFRLSANGCMNLNAQPMTLLVNPTPSGANITGDYTSEVCSGSMNQLFSSEQPQASGVSYVWSADNAVIWSTTDDKQYAYVNFPNSGNATITLSATYTATGCNVKSSATVSVGTGVADNPKIIYFQGRFVCLENDEDSYQWGYDDASYQPHPIDGAVNQDYKLDNADFGNNRYWVKTTRNGCTQTTFYNAPQGPSHRSAASPSLKIYPNPVNKGLNVELTNIEAGSTKFEISNMLGQKVITTTIENLSAVIDASNLVPGGYMIDCFREGVKIASTRFIKN